MRVSSVLPPLLIVAVVAVNAPDAPVRGLVTNKGLVANGEIYDPAEYPFVVCLTIVHSLRKGQAVCTGTLISPLFVLTAAHCTHNKLKHHVKVYRIEPSTEQRSSRSVHRIYEHRKYSGKTGHADISLLKLNKPFRNVERYAVLSGHPSNFDNDTALNCTIIGFGMINEMGELGINGYITNTLVKFGPNACELSFKIFIATTWEEYLCSKPDPHMVCPGDSGGPMICDGFQYGVASHAYNFRNSDEQASVACGSPDVQTRHVFVYAFKDWIAEVLRSKGTATTRRGRPYDHAVVTVSAAWTAVCARRVGSVKNAIAHACVVTACVFVIRSTEILTSVVQFDN